MKYIPALFLIPLILSGCQTIPLPIPNERNLEQGTKNLENLVHYSTNSGFNLFYTYPFEFSDLEKPDVLSGVIVKLGYENNCIYFQYGPHKAVPLLPYGVSSWDEKNHTLKYFNAIYKVGDTIKSGGAIFPKSEINGYTSNGFKTTPSETCDLQKILVLHGLPEL